MVGDKHRKRGIEFRTGDLESLKRLLKRYHVGQIPFHFVADKLGFNVDFVVSHRQLEFANSLLHVSVLIP